MTPWKLNPLLIGGIDVSSSNDAATETGGSDLPPDDELRLTGDRSVPATDEGLRLTEPRGDTTLFLEGRSILSGLNDVEADDALGADRTGALVVLAPALRTGGGDMTGVLTVPRS